MRTRPAGLVLILAATALSTATFAIAPGPKRWHPIHKGVPPTSEAAAAHRVEVGLSRCREVVKMLKTGTDRGGVLIGYLPIGPRPLPCCKLISEIDFANKDLMDEYYYAAGRLIFVRETVRTYEHAGNAATFDTAHPTYKEPVNISFVRGRIAGSPSLQAHYRSLTANSAYLIGVLKSPLSVVDVSEWVKGARPTIAPKVAAASVKKRWQPRRRVRRAWW